VKDGWINLYKARGLSSNAALSKVKKILKIKKAGHTGTLDPEAEGVLPIAIGEATKTITYITNEVKAYQFKIKFGFATDSGDLEGKIIAHSEHLPSKLDITRVLPEFTGAIKQIPPIYSAIKINGERAYDLARKGKEFEVPEREVTIHELQLLDYDDITQEASFLVECSKGTYVRSLGRDIAIRLRSEACCTLINRVKSGVFSSDFAITLEELEKIVYSGELKNYLKAVEFVLDDIPVVNLLTPQMQQKIRNGQHTEVPIDPNLSMFCKAIYQNKLVAVGQVVSGFFQPERVFNI